MRPERASTSVAREAQAGDAWRRHRETYPDVSDTGDDVVTTLVHDSTQQHRTVLAGGR